VAHPAHQSTAHDHDDVVLTVPVPRFPGMDWPGDDEVAHVPVALILAARGRCSCPDCCDGFVALLRRSRLRAV
jgi:hypothetical protein